MAASRATRTPSACRWCGIPEREHYQQWTDIAGWHEHTAPTDTQILTRMKARRAARNSSNGDTR